MILVTILTFKLLSSCYSSYSTQRRDLSHDDIVKRCGKKRQAEIEKRQVDLSAHYLA